MRTPLIAWAESEATRLLSVFDGRWSHTCAVARRSAVLAGTMRPRDGEVLVAAALLHDIGYAPDLIRSGHHGLDGAAHLAALGHHRLATLVAHHTASAAEAALLGLADVHHRYVRERSPVADGLTYFDITTGPGGHVLTLQQRVDDVADRYGRAHLVARAMKASMAELLCSARRTEALLVTKESSQIRQ